MESAYREARSSEQERVSEDLRELFSTAGVLVVDAQGHGIIAAKIASTVHDTFRALMLSELDYRGKTTPDLFERVNLRLARSVTARNALGRSEQKSGQEVATMLYGELRPYGYFRFLNFGHVPPLVFSAEYGKFMEVDRSRMAQFLPLGLQIPEDHPDRERYFSLESREQGTLFCCGRAHLAQSRRHYPALYGWRLRRQRQRGTAKIGSGYAWMLSPAGKGDLQRHTGIRGEKR
jgi:hypothetical protein